MNQIRKTKQKKEAVKLWFYFAASLAVTIILLIIFPGRRSTVIKFSWQIFLEMIAILPAVMLLIGFFSVWAPKETVIRLMGKTSGIR